MSQFKSATQESSELATSTVPTTRWNVSGMLQALLEEGALLHGMLSPVIGTIL